MTERIFRPTYLVEDQGELGRLPDGATINIGGTIGPYFTVGGRALLFADGSTTGPSTSGINLQNTYDNGLTGQINLTSTKNFVVNALNGNKLTIDAATGHVTIDGDLSILGASNIIEGTVSNLDQVNIGLPNTSTVGFTLQPNIGITPATDLVQIRNVYSGTPVLKVDALGATTLNTLYVTSGLFNGINIQTLADHLSNSVSPAKHTATQVSYSQGSNVNVTGATVQAALDSIETALTSFTASDVRGFEHVQTLASDTWTIVHGFNSNRVSATIWDASDEMILPDKVKIITLNTIQVTFNTALTGRAILMIF